MASNKHTDQGQAWKYGWYTQQPQTSSSVGNPMHADRKGSIVLAAAVVAMGLLAGLFYAWDISVMPALIASEDRTFVDFMQRSITAIENPGFFLPLMGAPVLATIALFQARRSGSKAVGWIVAGLAFYMVMVIVTVAFHFPLNQGILDKGDPASIENLAEVRDDFVTPWIAWNIVRTLSATAAFVCLTWALVLRGRTARA